jgi:hypothetical protein
MAAKPRSFKEPTGSTDNKAQPREEEDMEYRTTTREHDDMVGTSGSLIAAHDLRERLMNVERGALRARLAGDLHEAARLQREAKRMHDYIIEVGA